MPEITQLLAEARGGNPERLNDVFALVYPELKRIAGAAVSRHRGSPVTTTALVHSAYLKLIRAEGLDLKDRRHFFGCAARAMRQILVDQVRAAMADKRGGGQQPVTLPQDLADEPFTRWLDLDDALDDLDKIDTALREIVELRFFAGLTEDEIAELRGCSKRTIQRGWRTARAFLYTRLN